MTIAATKPVPAGKKVYFVGHSFHMFVVRPLITLAKEAGIPGHWAEGWDMIGGSTPMQHWERGGDDNEVKAALRSGRVDVLTLCSNVIIPEPAIELFADLAATHNPSVRVMLQHSWGDAGTTQIMRARHAPGATLTPGTLPDGVPGNEIRDAASAADLAELRASAVSTMERLRAQLAAVELRHGRPFTSIVPAGEAVVRLREAVIAGEVPGIVRQSELFRDALGHATQPTVDLVTYLWFMALYGLDVEGMTSLVDPADRDSAARQRVLQRLAREAHDAELRRDRAARPER